MPDPAPTAEETFTAWWPRCSSSAPRRPDRASDHRHPRRQRQNGAEPGHAALRKLRAESAELAELIGSTRENEVSS
jgi:hypothetical protein